MLGLLAHEFTLTPAMVSIIPVVTQLGNAAGIIVIAPLGDRLERKSLILATMAALIVALITAALAPTFAWVAVASLGIGLFATVTQQLVPFAVQLAAPIERGRVLGLVTGGILSGILLARTFAGAVSEFWGWRAVFWAAAGMMLAVAVLLATRLPRVKATTDLNYIQLLRSMGSLLREHSAEPLRRAVTLQALIFSAFIAFWSNLALVFEGPSYQLGPTAVGMMALVGVGGALAAPVAGRFADKSGPTAVISSGAALVVTAFAIFGLFQGSLLAMVAGVMLMDLAVQASQVANQARVYALDPTARSRLNTIFMATMIFGGACGAGAGGLAYSMWGWTGTCAFGAAAAGLALLLSWNS